MKRYVMRLIPVDPEGTPDFLDVADQEQWQYLKQVRGEPGDRIVQEHIFQPRGSTVLVHEVKDAACKVTYILVSSESIKEIEEVIQRIEKRMPIWDPEALWKQWTLAMSQQDPEAKIRTTAQLALTAPSLYEKDYFMALERSLQSEEGEVRYGTLKALGYVGWKEFLPLLDQIAKTDTEPRVRFFAKHLAIGIRKEL